MKVLISQRAEDDLARIYTYLAARNPDAAERFKTEAENALALLGAGSEHRSDPILTPLSPPQPDDPSSAIASTRLADCKRDDPPPFAATAHG